MEQWKLHPARDAGLTPRERSRSVLREPGLVSTTAAIMCSAVVRLSLHLYHRMRVVGSHHLPSEPPFVLIANHTSHLDALILASPLPARLRSRIYPVAAGDVFFETPVLPFLASGLINALPMWRKRCGAHAMQDLRRRLVEDPCAYILFPEGARSRDGRLMKFRAGLGMLVAQTSVPVVPCRITGAFESLAAGRRFPRPHGIRLDIGPPLVFESTPNDRSGWDAIAAASEGAVRRLAIVQESE